jgi:hypothetical protein
MLSENGRCDNTHNGQDLSGYGPQWVVFWKKFKSEQMLDTCKV